MFIATIKILIRLTPGEVVKLQNTFSHLARLRERQYLSRPPGPGGAKAVFLLIRLRALLAHSDPTQLQSHREPVHTTQATHCVFTLLITQPPRLPCKESLHKITGEILQVCTQTQISSEQTQAGVSRGKKVSLFVLCVTFDPSYLAPWPWHPHPHQTRPDTQPALMNEINRVVTPLHLQIRPQQC